MRNDPENDIFLDLAEIFHENTKIRLSAKRNRKQSEINSSPVILNLVTQGPKRYLTSCSKDLPCPVHLEASLEDIFRNRQSIRQFSNCSLDITKLSTILYLSNFVHDIATNNEYKFYHRPTPTSGGLCSVEIYLLALRVEGLEQGIYHYDSLNHSLILLKNGNFKENIIEKMVFQSEFSDAAVFLIITSWFSKLKFKYGERGYRYGLLDAGHVGAHIYLASSALNLACCGICGFIDDEVNKLIGVNGLDESAVYLVAVGEK